MNPYNILFTPKIVESMKYFLPETILIVTILVVFIVELFFKKKTNVSGWIAMAGFILAFIFTIQQVYNPQQVLFFQMIVLDPFAVFFKILLLISGFLIIIFSFLSSNVKLV